MDVADSPIVELRLSEIYDVETSTINDDYLLVLQDYVALQLRAALGLCDLFKFRLLGSRFIQLHCRENGDIVSLRKPALERLIQQTLQNRLDVASPVSVSILIQFKTPGFRIPQRLHEPSYIPPKIGGVVRHNSDVITALPTGVREDSQYACPLLLQHLAGKTPTDGGIPLTDSTAVDSFVPLEQGTCVLFRTYPQVYPGNIINCPTDLVANKGETVTLQNDFIDSTNDDRISETVQYQHPVDRGRLLLDTSMLGPSSTSARVVANNPIYQCTRDALLGITPHAGAARHTDNCLDGCDEHAVNAMSSPLVSTWLPILLKY